MRSVAARLDHGRCPVIRAAMHRMAGSAALSALLASGIAWAAEPLPSFNVDLGRTTVSGLSSGAFMAHQFHIAFSGTVRGAGIVAGGPYYCAQGQLALALNRCMQIRMGTPDPAVLLAIARGYAGQGLIDPLENLADARTYLFTGTRDQTVAGPVVEAVRQFYLRAGLPAANLEYRHDVAAGHAMLTEDFGNSCASTGPPYLNDCDDDQAGAILKALYPDLKPAAIRPGGKVVAFDQSEFFRAGDASGPASGPLPGVPWPMPGMGRATLGLNDTGYAYIPAACMNGDTCKVHIAFHGCKQTVDDIQDKFIEHAGYNRWADSNDIIVLYPQIKRDRISNPNGCWDWWGYSGADYATKTGPQMAAIRAMLDRLAAGR